MIYDHRKARAMWTPGEITYEHTSNVVPFPGSHARANAAQAAQLLETDRREVRREEIRRTIETLKDEIRRRRGLIEMLRAEDRLLAEQH